MDIKRAISFALMLVMLLSVVGCNGNGDQPSQSPSEGNTSVSPENDISGDVTETKITFQNTDTGIELVGVLFTPPNFDENEQTPAVLMGGPLASVKEQTQSIYAKRLAELGYITMVFDYTYYGESGGEPRRLENPSMKDSDIKSAVTYLQSLSYVDSDKIAAVGICGSGGQMTYTAASDSRIKTVAAVVPYGYGMNAMPQMLSDEQGAELIAQRDAYEAGEAEPVYAGAYPVPYYTDPERGGIPEFDTIGTVTWSTLYFADYDLEAALKQLNAPLLIISPEESLSDTAERMNEFATGPKEYHFIEGSNHFDHYDLEPYVTDNVRLIETFFQTNFTDSPAPQPSNAASQGEASAENEESTEEEAQEMQNNGIRLQIGETILTATLTDNSSAQALMDLLAAGPVTIDMRDYGDMEKVGGLGADLPTNNEQITTEPGDLILFQGNAFVIYYAPNSWNFTRLGKINDVSAEELKEILGDGNVRVTLSLNRD